MADEKKFADEMLTDDKLENVVGGTYKETAGDSQFLNLYGLCPRYIIDDISFHSGTSHEENVKTGWAKVGIDFVYRGDYFVDIPNRYFLNGKEITRAEAFQHLIEELGDPMSAYLKNHT